MKVSELFEGENSSLRKAFDEATTPQTTKDFAFRRATDEEVRLPMLKEQMVAAFNNKLDTWLATNDHKYNCIGYNEGCACCLDRVEGESIYGKTGRPKLDELLSTTLDTYAEAVRREERV
jgi:hypothetical protein